VVIVDTTVWIDYLHEIATPETEWLDTELTRQPLGLVDLMVCEILQGLSTDAEAARVLRDLQRFEICETGSVELAVAAAQNYRTLRAQGHTVRKTIDCLIATFCLREGHSLLHCDRDFDPFEQLLGLNVVHPHPKPFEPPDDSHLAGPG
jgi:predicted nucleic acid-binding protein